MKRVMHIVLCACVVAGVVGNSVYAWNAKVPSPLSPESVTAATVVSSACVWGLATMGLFASASADVPYYVPAASAPFVALLPAAVVGALTWLIFSSFTAQAYADSAYAILSGEHCIYPELLEYARQAGGDEQVFAQRVLRYYANCTYERLCAVDALGILEKQLLRARTYFLVAQKGGRYEEGLAESLASTESYIEVVRAGILEIKNHPDYQAQREAELHEQGIQAQYTAAHVLAQAILHTPHVQYHNVYVRH